MSKKRAVSVRPPPLVDRPKNRLLSTLAPDVYHRLLPDLEVVPMRPKMTLHKAGESLQHIVFPNGGVCSITTLMPSGTMVEAATVGDEGMLGIESFFTENAVAPGETMVQVPDGSFVRLGVKAFRRELA